MKKKTVSLSRIVEYTDRLLDTQAIEDWPGACNGLQVENRQGVTRLAATVDATLATVRLAIAGGAEMLIAHHGLFWGPRHPWTGVNYRLLREVADHDLAVYSAHLPLDVHPRLGNNALFCTALGFKKCQPFFWEKGRHLGLRTLASLTRDELSLRQEKVLGSKPLLLPGGSQLCRNIGVVTGGAGDELRLAAAEGVDTLITGEGKHWTHALAEELGMNVFYGGHYATETFGVKALGAHLAKQFQLDWFFVDHPSGL